MSASLDSVSLCLLRCRGSMVCSANLATCLFMIKCGPCDRMHALHARMRHYNDDTGKEWL